MRIAARLKLGYYPLPVEQGPMLRARLSFPREVTSALDPCCGTGAALHALTVDSNTTLYGVELDANRAISARESGIQTIHGNVFDVRARVERFSFLYLNPPYDFEVCLATIPSGREAGLMYEFRVQICDEFQLERA